MNVECGIGSIAEAVKLGCEPSVLMECGLGLNLKYVISIGEWMNAEYRMGMNDGETGTKYLWNMKLVWMLNSVSRISMNVEYEIDIIKLE